LNKNLLTEGSMKIIVNKKKIGADSPVFTIAEIGCNFEGVIGRAKEMIEVAAQAGADAVKFQSFIPKKLVSKYAEKFWEIEGCPGRNQLEEFEQMPKLSFAEYKVLKEAADRLGVIFFSTPYDEESVDMLERLDVPLYKISSMDITHIPFLRYIARKKKPIIISTGASNIEEVEEAVKIMKNEGSGQIGVLHCITNYPTKDVNINLRMITHLKNVFPELVVGYSDHTLPDEGEGIITAAVALGAKIIEKHFTFDNRRPGYDHEISVDYEGLRRMIIQIRRVEKALGEDYKRPIDAEAKARIHGRRSIVAAKNIVKGAVIAKDMLEIKRPATGIEPKFIDSLLGKRACKDIKVDQPINWEMIAGNEQE